MATLDLDNFDSVRAHLRKQLQDALPGTAAHLRMAPTPRPGWKPGEIPGEAREAAGLLLIYPEAQPKVVLTVRSHELPTHKGQVSLPGGMAEDGETLEETALREAQEEAGIDRDLVHVEGRLTPLYIPVSKFVLHPFVGFSEEPPELVAEEREVSRILEVPLSTFTQAEYRAYEKRDILGMSRTVPYFAIEGEKLWGATAMVMAELLWLLGAPPPPPRAR